MRKLLWLAVVFGLAYFAFDESNVVSDVGNDAAVSDSYFSELYESRRSNVQVQGNGEVIRVLSDDINGDRH